MESDNNDVECHLYRLGGASTNKLHSDFTFIKSNILVIESSSTVGGIVCREQPEKCQQIMPEPRTGTTIDFNLSGQMFLGEELTPKRQECRSILLPTAYNLDTSFKI